MTTDVKMSGIPEDQAITSEAAIKRGKLIAGFGFSVLVITTVIAVVYPFYWIVMASFTPEGYSMANSPLIIPGEFSIQPYINALETRPLMRWVMNTLLVTMGATAISLPLALLAGYALQRFRFRGRIAFIFFILTTQLLPASALMIPLFIIFRDLRLLDTLTGITIAYMTFTLPLAIWILWGYLQSIPAEFEEAAMVDGCTQLGAFVRVTIPLAMPGVAATALFIFLEGWNQYLLAYVLTSSSQNWVISLGLFSFIGEYHVELEQMLAASVVTALPALVLFAILQRYLRGGLALGGLRG